MLPCCKKKLPTQPDIPAVLQPTITSFSSEPSSVEYGESSVLSWSTKNATTISINQGIGTVSATGTEEVSPETTTTYTLTAKNSAGQKTASCEVEVTEVVLNPPTIEYFTATPESIKLGEFSELSWSVIDATTLIMEKSTEPGSLVVPLVGTQLVSPIETITYTLTATNDDGETTAFCEIEILPSAMIELSWVVIHAIYHEADLFEVVYEFDMQESGGVGGQINELAIRILDNKGNVILDYLPVASFEPSSTFSYSARPTMSWAPKLIKVWVNGVDDNGYKFSHDIGWGFSW